MTTTRLSFGAFLSPDAGRRDETLAHTLAAEEAGLDLVEQIERLGTEVAPAVRALVGDA